MRTARQLPNADALAALVYVPALGDSEMNAVNFLQTGVATFVCPGNIPSSSHVRGLGMAWQFRLRGLLTGGCFDEVETVPEALLNAMGSVWSRRTGGTSIDSANLHLPPGQRAFDSYMLRAYERIAEADQIDEKVGRNSGGLAVVAAKLANVNRGDSEINPVNFLQTGVATFVCPGNNRFILPRARRFAWAFANLHLPPGHRAFDSYMLRTYERIAEADQIDEKDLGNLFDYSHSRASVRLAYPTLGKQLNFSGAIRLIPKFDALMAEFGRHVELPEEDLMSNWYFKADYEAFGYPKPDF
ncbi:hypothetical protein AK812_SmicGene30672 [Symbiodinium microadriaticum]|uniref:Uncharacterized protein n=1 Tax=Symbiodinium microadriaticum TaxID=2951 RepID=A0A1Q9CYM2_SYMMI|nr:hypothetical protein AK812_SmicGene30672 [Symbiodinium microadriaticum]